MEPRHLGARAVLARSFARIHETNLKKQGMLALTFADPPITTEFRKTNAIDILGLTAFAEGKPLTLVLHHQGGATGKDRRQSQLQRRANRLFAPRRAEFNQARRGSKPPTRRLRQTNEELRSSKPAVTRAMNPEKGGGPC